MTHHYYTSLVCMLLVFCCLTVHLTSSEETTTEKHEDHDDFDMDDFFNDDNTDDDGHLAHHLKEDIGIEKSFENMTDVEKDWYYFKLHDTNTDMRLDGLELLKAWQHHYLEHMGHNTEDHASSLDTEAKRRYAESQNTMFIEMVDNILKETDKNNDGYLDYFEYMMAKLESREKEEKAKAKEKETKEGKS